MSSVACGVWPFDAAGPTYCIDIYEANSISMRKYAKEPGLICLKELSSIDTSVTEILSSCTFLQIPHHLRLFYLLYGLWEKMFLI